MNPEIAPVAAVQGGCFTTAQAYAAGWSRQDIAAARRAGRWLQLTKGTYVDTTLWDAMTEIDRHLCTVHAALLTRASEWHAGRRSAALAHGLPLLGKLPMAPQLLRQPLRTTDRSSSRHHRLASLPDAETAVRRNLRVSGLARTVIDIAREESFESGVIVADGALGQGLTREELLAVADRCRRWPGGRRALRVANFADGLAESALESRSRVSLERCGLPPPELQVEIWLGQRFLGRADALWREANLIGEADGRGKYSSPDVLYAEKVRQEGFEDVGLVVVRWGWRTAANRDGELETKIRRGLERGRRSTLNPAVRFVPTTVEQALRRDQTRRAA